MAACGGLNTEDLEPNNELPLPPMQLAMLNQLADEKTDYLLVLARGLGLHRVAVAYLRLHCDPRCLVLCINTNEQERKSYLEILSRIEPKCPPKLVTSTTATDDRTALYMQGGI
jgi:DNA excision repair protein ERCC-4